MPRFPYRGNEGSKWVDFRATRETCELAQTLRYQLHDIGRSAPRNGRFEVR